MSPRPRWLARYQDGEHQEVWRELRALGDRVREPAFAPEAQAVCDEWAHRVRENLDRIVERLSGQGYRFHTNDDEQLPAAPLTPPTPTAEEHLRWLETTFGPVSMTLSAWVRIVGDVWLVGTHPRWPGAPAADPFVFEVEGARYPDEDVRAFLLEELEQWEDASDGEPFALPVAPDALHKENVSGGPPYGIVLPSPGADARIVISEEMSLVDYVRQVVGRGGFPGCSDADRDGDVISSLRSGLVPL